MANHLGVLVLSYGGPEREQDVEGFLRRVMSPREPSQSMIAHAVERYRAIGGGSPLVANTRLQAQALASWFEGRGSEALDRDEPVRVGVGFKNWSPDIGTALGHLAEAGTEQVHAVILASHQSTGATGGYESALRSAAEEQGVECFVVPSWHRDEGYIEAVAARAVEAAGSAARDEGTPLLFSAHSLPLVEGRPDTWYQKSLEETAADVAGKLGRTNWRLAYQSRSPRPGVEWMGPDITDVLHDLARKDDRLLVVPLGFVSEHLETLYDLDVELNAIAREAGLTMYRARTVGDDARFIDSLGRATLSSIRGTARTNERRRSASS